MMAGLKQLEAVSLLVALNSRLNWLASMVGRLGYTQVAHTQPLPTLQHSECLLARGARERKIANFARLSRAST